MNTIVKRSVMVEGTKTIKFNESIEIECDIDVSLYEDEGEAVSENEQEFFDEAEKKVKQMFEDGKVFTNEDVEDIECDDFSIED